MRQALTAIYKYKSSLLGSEHLPHVSLVVPALSEVRMAPALLILKDGPLGRFIWS